MRVVSVSHIYPPRWNAGAEVMLHQVLRHLVSRGHTATAVVTWDSPGVATIDGVRRVGGEDALRELRGADVAITHLDETPRATELTRRLGIPLVHFVHGARRFRGFNLTGADCALAVFNSANVRRDAGWGGPSLTLNPPVLIDDYRTATTRERVSTVSLYGAVKGAGLFWRIAGAMRDTRFLAAQGAYGPQDVRRASNVEVIANTPDPVRDIYARTRILLAPSQSETWGRAVIEAACSGIPAVVSPAEGFAESIGDAAIVAPLDVRAWVRAIQHLKLPAVWSEYSARARARAAELDARSREQLGAFERALMAL